MTEHTNVITPASNDAKNSQTRPLNIWAVYGICLLISTIFYFIFGFNSPVYTFNSDHDYNWFITMGHGLVGGQLPYRDLFDHKGPIVYFVTAFCCLFKNPNIVMLFIEIICLSLFFFFAYRIAKKRLNTFFSLLTILILALAVFTSWCRLFSADAIEELFLPIYAYFLLCWLEFLLEKHTWNWTRAICLGLCFGIIFWSKYTLFYFMLVPMLIWLIISLRARQYRIIVLNLIMMFVGVIIITIPNIAFFAANNALSDLIYVYFIVNLTSYGSANPLMILTTAGLFFVIGPLILFLIIWGVIRFAIRYWHKRTGWLLLIAFVINWALLVFTSKEITYYFIGLVPYSILGATDILSLISNKLILTKHRRWLYTAITVVCIIICLPFSTLIQELGRGRETYTPLVIADVIHEYESTHNTAATLYCYKIGDFGFYNAAGIIPNNYYFCNNLFTEDDYPEMYQCIHDYVTNQTSDFIITKLDVWNNEQDFLSMYYKQYNDTIYHYHQLHYFFYREHDFVLLIKK